jgi:diguanylate cyclase (GGDEF)-like protein
MIAHETTRRRVLVIDDNESVHDDFRKILQAKERPQRLTAAKAAVFGTPADARSASGALCFEVDSALRGEDGLEMVRAALGDGQPYALAFVDMRMPPGWNGLTTVKKLWEADADLQIVICTAYSDYSLDQLSDELANTDKLLILKKPFDNAEAFQMAAALTEKWQAQRAAAMKLDELKRMVQERTAEIEYATLHDKLTGLPNRTFLQMRLEGCLQRRARKSDFKFAVLFLDFDRFKLINDSLGHEVGDLVLIEVADRLRQALRGGDALTQVNTPSRLGGDEFIVLLEDLRDERDAARVAERLLRVLAEPYVLETQKLHLTASIGIATSDRGYERAGDILRDADTAMYRAKAAGRARYVMFDQAMHQEVMSRLSLESALRRAVRDDLLTLHYQPIVRLADGRLCGFEALVRWTDPNRGPIPAPELIAVAEENGLIQPLSLSVLRAASRQLRTWQQRFRPDPPLMMNVNLSRKQLLDPELVDKVRDTIQNAGVEPNSLILEITESAVHDDQPMAVQVFEQLKQMGVWLHLDDFGTGYSSLSCLYQLPLSGLKIDRSFIRNISSERAHAVVLDAIVRIARAFNLKVVAEGVEDTEQLGMLRALGIDHGQGYLFGKPAPAHIAERMLEPEHEGALLEAGAAAR